MPGIESIPELQKSLEKKESALDAEERVLDVRRERLVDSQERRFASIENPGPGTVTQKFTTPPGLELENKNLKLRANVGSMARLVLSILVVLGFFIAWTAGVVSILTAIGLPKLIADLMWLILGLLSAAFVSQVTK